jgi:hypothetical protein
MNSIEFAQLENLLRQRVPFRLFKVVASWEQGLGPMEKIALRNCAISLMGSLAGERLQEILTHLREDKVDLQFPIVIAMEDEKKSAWLQAEIEKHRFQNVFYLREAIT